MADNNSLVIKINGSAKNFLDELDKVKKSTKSLESVLSKTAKASAIAFAAFAGSIALVTKAFADYEKALVGVGKTTDIEGKKLQAFGKEFQKLSEEIPLSTNELLGIAQAAGQLGVTGEKNLLKFTETIAKLGVATDLTGEQGATQLTRILNVTNESISSIDKFGSVIVALGNNFAATESEIVKVTTEVARSTSVFNVSSAEAAALATALKSVGVQAQLGGSAVGRAFREIDKAVRNGGAGLEKLSDITGIAGEDLKQAFEEDATGVFQKFIEGLGEIQKQGGSTTEALAAFGLKGDEILKVLPVLAKNSHLLGKALKIASDETENATALNKEAEKAFNTLDAELIKTKNSLTNAAVVLGEELAPLVIDILKSVREFAKSLRSLDKETVKSIANVIKWGAGIAGTIAAMAAFFLGALKISAIIGAVGAAFLPATIAASAFWIALTGPIGIAVAGIAALTVGAIALFKVLNKEEEPKTLQQINKELDSLKKKREDINKLSKFQRVNRNASAEIKAISDEVKALEELRQQKLKSSKDFGTGKALLRPADSKGADDLFPDLGQVDIPLAVEKEEDNFEKTEKKKTTFLSKELKERLAKRKIVNEEINKLTKDQQAALEQDAIDRINKRALTEQEVQSNLAEEQLTRQVDARNQYLADEIEFGSTLATAKQFFQQKEVQGAKQASGQLIQLTQSKNATLKTIGKVAASTNAAIATAEGSIKAYSSLAGIPLVGPGLGIAAAGALVAYGVEQQATILAANKGGRVPSNMGIPGRDSVPSTLTPGETVTPDQSYDEMVNAVADERIRNKEGAASGGAGGGGTVVLKAKGGFMDYVETSLVRRSKTGKSKLPKGAFKI